MTGILGGARGLAAVSASVLAVAGGLVFGAAPVFAAAPEVPELSVTPPVFATSATFAGVLNPAATEPVAELTYSFLYNQGASCEGGSQTTPVTVMEVARDEVSETVGGLSENSGYAVCLRVEEEGASAKTVAVPFHTALAPQTPVTVEAKPVAGTTATLVGELNPTASAKDAYEFTYGAGGGCSGETTTLGGEVTGKETKVSTAVSGLEGSTEYTFCAVELNDAGEEAKGTPVAFKTLASQPVVASLASSGVTPFDAVLEGQVNPENEATKYHFEYATNMAMSGATSVGEGSIPGVGEPQAVGPVDIGGGLTPAMTYYYRVIASNATGVEEHGPIEEFTTLAAEAPLIDGESVTGVTQTDAQLHALVNPDYQETEYQFKIGTSTAYSLGSAPAALTSLGGAGFFGDLEPAVDLNGEGVTLAANTEYHYEILATNPSGSSEGLTSTPGDQTLITLPEAPTVSTGPATQVLATTATVSESVNPNALAAGGNTSEAAQDKTIFYIQYGTTSTYGKETPVQNAGEGTTPTPQATTLAGLQPGTTYHYRIVASNLNNASELVEQHPGVYPEGLKPQTTYGEEDTFTTPSTPPILTGLTATAVTETSATITASLDPQNLPTRYQLLLATNPALLQPAASGNSSTSTPLTLTTGSLTPGTTYYYQLTATNANGTSETAVQAFTTSPPPAATPSPPPPALIPYTTIGEITAREARENPATKTTSTGPPTTAQKLAKALKACHHDKNKHKRAACERQAHKHYPATKHTATRKTHAKKTNQRGN